MKVCAEHLYEARMDGSDRRTALQSITDNTLGRIHYDSTVLLHHVWMPELAFKAANLGRAVNFG